MKSRFLIALALLAAVGTTRAEHPRIVFPDDAGVVDVTQPPYNAKGDGVTDDTEAINRALRDHNRGHDIPDEFMSFTIYFPEGTYLVSDTLEPKDPNNPKLNQSAVRFVGESRDRTTIRLKDNAEKFQNSERPRPILRTGNKDGRPPNCGYGNYIQHLTVDSGRGNPGAIGVRFDVANNGAMDNVRIVCHDARQPSHSGLAIMGIAGLGYVKKLEVEGFERGIYLDEASVNNIAFEGITLRGQHRFGIENLAKNIQILGLNSRNAVPALCLKQSLATTFLLDAHLDGTASAGSPAIATESPEAFLYLRDIKTVGYDSAVKTAEPPCAPPPPSPEISEWWSQDAPFMEGTRPESLRLPILPAPEYFNDTLDEWANVEDFGATKDSPEDDDAPAIQRAIDSGKPVIYFPRGVYQIKSDVIVRGAVRKIDFLFSKIEYPTGSDYPENSERAQAQHALAGKPGFVVREVESDAVILENLSQFVPIIHDSTKTVVVRNRGGSHRGVITVGDAAAGNLFVENAGPHATVMIRNGIRAWLRAVNREKSGMTNVGSTVWSFADNIETMLRHSGDRTVLPMKTTGGGTSEIIGACIDVLATFHEPEDGALVEIDNSTVSFNGAGEVRKKNGVVGEWPVIISERNGNQTRIIGQKDVVVWPPGADQYPKRLIVPLFRADP